MEPIGELTAKELGFLFIIATVTTLVLGGVTFMTASWSAGGADEGITGQVVEGNDVNQFCSDAGFFINRAYAGPGSYDLSMQLSNTGSVPLSGFSMRITFKDKTLKTVDFPDLKLSGKFFKTIYLISAEKIEEVAVKSAECEGETDSVSENDIRRMSTVAF
jgi:hypothetical protein